MLREVIQRLQNGEDVDVERMLGSGDSAQEKEWEEVMKEVQSDDALWKTKQRKREEKEFAKAEQEAALELARTREKADSASPSRPAGRSGDRRPGFY